MAKFTPRKPTLTARQKRVLEALVVRMGWIWREEIDHIAGASNGPEIIRQLRRRHGIEIDMVKVEKIDRDGSPCKPGKYKITEHGVEAASAYLGGAQ